MDGADGNLREQLKRPQIPFGPEPGQIAEFAPRPAHARGPRRRPRAPPATDLELFNGIGGFADDGREYVISRRSGSRRAAAGAVVERRRAPDVRVRGDRVRPRLHVVEQQPRQPAHAVAQRSGQRSAGRGGLPARRGDRRSSGRRRRCPPEAAGRTSCGTARATRLRARPRRHRLDAAAVRAADRRRSRSSASRCATTRPARRRCTVTLYVEWVLGENRVALAAARRHQPRPGDRRASWRATRSGRSSPTASRSSICTRATSATVTGDRTEFLGRNGTLRAPSALRARSRCRTAPAPAFDPCGAIQVTVALEPSRDADARRPARRRGRRRGGARAGAAATASPAAVDDALQQARGVLGSVCSAR